MAEAEDAGGATAAAGDEIKPYRIHVSTKYLDLTKQKLELTRLPHESSEPKSRDWWEPKPQIEPLIDFWLEKYSWRDQENSLNSSLPQFRTAIAISSSATPPRLHFIHIRSSQPNAVPLLLIPPFPFTNLSFGHLVKQFTDPEDAARNQSFHLVIPSLPGLGFSDPLPNNTPVIYTVAEMLNTLMSRLSYDCYLVTNSGAASSSPAEIDWKLVNQLATHYSSSCLGAHLISPPLASPRLREFPLEWAKWSIANFFHAGILGYSIDDFSALKRAQASAVAAASAISSSRKGKFTPTPTEFGLNKFGLREPNTLAYALCDSPTGLLVFVIKGLRLLGPAVNFTPEQIITFAELAWLPGPEYAMRLWAHCAAHEDEEEKKRERETKVAGLRPRVAITVFLGGKERDDAEAATAAEAAPQDAADGGVEVQRAELPVPLPLEERDRYTCPAWGRARYDVLFTQRLPGKPGLLAWERPEVIAAGVRGLAKEILRLDKRLKPSAAEPATAPLQRIIVAEEPRKDRAPAEQSTPEKQTPSQEQVARQVVLPKIPEEPFAHEGEGPTPNLQPTEQEGTKGKEPEKVEKATGEDAKETAGEDVKEVAEEMVKEATHGQDQETASEVVREKGAEAFSDEESPDTLVVTTPPLDLR